MCIRDSPCTARTGDDLRSHKGRSCSEEGARLQARNAGESHGRGESQRTCRACRQCEDGEGECSSGRRCPRQTRPRFDPCRHRRQAQRERIQDAHRKGVQAYYGLAIACRLITPGASGMKKALQFGRSFFCPGTPQNDREGRQGSISAQAISRTPGRSIMREL